MTCKFISKSTPNPIHPPEEGDPSSGLASCVDLEQFWRNLACASCHKDVYVHIMFYVYIIANRKLGAIYTGQCDDLLKRIWEHKTKRYGGHSAKYDIDRLMWFEIHETRDSAFKRERQIKGWNREWRLNLFGGSNPHWDDLFHSLTEETLCDPDRMYPHNFSQSEYQIELANSR